METFELLRTGLPELEFRGTLLAELNGADADGSTDGRRTGISLFKADDGQFIVAIRFRSRFSSEPNDDYVEAADSEDEVDAIMSVYSPTDRLDEGLFDRDAQPRRRAIGSRLLRRYDEQVASVLKVLRSDPVVTDQPTSESTSQ